MYRWFKNRKIPQSGYMYITTISDKKRASKKLLAMANGLLLMIL